ncbi:CHRD domain-containing protein [Nakamurella sp. YIM 132087]|uniref:CHRD domain-containing protein n=1 Tax=Nakamurella alba TaxID=2665158 RepID=A0A7K1FVG7_9ACTN|nr:CHRD domain-containing protein [Nakamurella alba]MTD17359.1 CHRD domain-containing protein [Nakamurella alba]
MSTKRVTRLGAAAAMVAAGALLFGPVGSAAAADEEVAAPATFTSAFTAMATPDMVVNADNVPTPGTAGAMGTFNYRINSDLEIVCYDITVTGITTPYQSPARTATHIHQGNAGSAGPPRLAFPNPVEQADGSFRSEGCMQAPFTTGVKDAATGADTGDGFSLKQIEADPAAFFTDTHTAANPAGAVRGQLVAVPVGGVETGAGGTAVADAAVDESGFPALPLAGGLALMAGVAVLVRRQAVAGK